MLAETGKQVADEAPKFENASVHDPSVIKVEDTYYVFGSHLAAAKTTDFMNWTQIASGVHDGNPLIPNVTTELAETLEWAQSNTLWAPDVIQLPDGRFYMYYNACKGDSPLSAMGVAVADHVEGPYKDLGIMLKSGMWGQPSEDGTVYDATVHPNVVDPHVFFDKENKLWMVYGSYSGGIYILEMDSKTGFPYPDQGYGKKLLGANHSRIEGPYMLYSPETDYYYMFLSYGGLDAIGGYNIRVVRSKAPDGPFEDAEGHDMTGVGGPAGTFFDDEAIAPYGVKLMGNVQFDYVEGETPGVGTAYVSPGHNSAYYDKATGKYYLIFHTRFPNRGESHEVRVHQMFLNEDGWPVVAPHRYSGETIGAYEAAELVGDYKFVRHGKDITAEVKASSIIHLGADGKVSGSETGTWRFIGDHGLELKLDGSVFRGGFLRQWDGGTMQNVIVFSALSEAGEAAWGSRVGLKE
ncbi:glycoside hydrolase family 43 protein [Paenibacillus lentus]|uniref:Arabinan endo-1,5-alpha-L-arabinosidase n=1 Tax=Paenibacillus lentus TaxID=1338368 RepID=A0A3Q8S7D5_9BACL|nr:glycoside hydrolase family 43 protein [Paenibacillus lentus]AZK48997.1 arabinan endo-1,5-alpha-L-arabinosidase [Paenibacillus lentus]